MSFNYKIGIGKSTFELYEQGSLPHSARDLVPGVHHFLGDGMEEGEAPFQPGCLRPVHNPFIGSLAPLCPASSVSMHIQRNTVKGSAETKPLPMLRKDSRGGMCAEPGKEREGTSIPYQWQSHAHIRGDHHLVFGGKNDLESFLKTYRTSSKIDGVSTSHEMNNFYKLNNTLLSSIYGVA